MRQQKWKWKKDFMKAKSIWCVSGCVFTHNLHQMFNI